MGLHRLKAGSHCEGAGDTYRRWNAPPGKDAPPVVVESDRDLSAEFPEKFEPWRGDAPAGSRGTASKAPKAAGVHKDSEDKPDADADDLDALTVAELRDLATSEGVELEHGYVPKADLIAAIEKSRGK